MINQQSNAQVQSLVATKESSIVEQDAICSTDDGDAYCLLTRELIGITQNPAEIANFIYNTCDTDFVIKKGSVQDMRNFMHAIIFTDTIWQNPGATDIYVPRPIEGFFITKRPKRNGLISPIGYLY